MKRIRKQILVTLPLLPTMLLGLLAFALWWGLRAGFELGQDIAEALHEWGDR